LPFRDIGAVLGFKDVAFDVQRRRAELGEQVLRILRIRDQPVPGLVGVLLADQPGLGAPRTAGPLAGEALQAPWLAHVLIAEGDELVLVADNDPVELAASPGAGFLAAAALGLGPRMFR